MLRKTDPKIIAPYLKDASNFFDGQANEVIIPETHDELVARNGKYADMYGTYLDHMDESPGQEELARAD